MPDGLLDQAVSPGGILTFILGVISGVLYWIVLKPLWCKLNHRPQPKYRIALNFTSIIMIIGIFAVVWTGVRLSELTTNVALCQEEFNTALSKSRDLNKEDRDLDVQWKTATLSRAARLIDIQKQFGNGPAYIEAKNSIDGIYFQTIQRIEDDRNDLEVRRAQNPYPEPTCGRKPVKA